jgi:arginase family enzyme
MSRTLILDFDGAVQLRDADTIPLRGEQEAIRFGCRMRALRRLQSRLEPHLSGNPKVVFMGSGDYHHVSYLLIEHLRKPGARMQVVVFDNHPDNMRYPFGIHCGSWVWHVSRLPFVARVHVVGIASPDVEGIHVFENHVAPLRSGRVVYWCVRRNLASLSFFGVTQSHSFDSMPALLDALRGELARTAEPVYLSIDKDVLAREVVQTNWDQGVMQLEELESAIAMLKGRVIGGDVVGDVSSYRYKSRFKRFLSALDGQPEIPDHSLIEWQAEHQRVNERLLSAIVSSSTATID